MFILIFFSGLLSQVFDIQPPYRVHQDIIYREQLIVEQNNYRNEDELLQFIESTMQTHLVPGLSVSVVKDDNIVWEKHLGHADIANDIFVDQNTMFILSSISKTVTATALMQLFEDGFFELDDDIDNYLPFNVNHPDYPLVPITFKMLLSHTSGIEDNWGAMPYYEGDSDVELNYYLNQYLTPGGNLYNSSSNFTNSMPGTNYSYSNIGAALIGLLVEEISAQPFNEYCNENIFEPLNMDNTSWFLSEINNLDQVALPYQITSGSGDTCLEIGCGIYDESNPCFCDSACIDYGDCCSDYDDVCGEDGSGSNQENLITQGNYGYADYPSGQLRTTSNNLARFMTLFMIDSTYNDAEILDPNTIELIKTVHYPQVNSTQGLIWYYKNENERTLFGHNGGDIGSLTEMFISFSNNIGVILLSNSSNYNAIVEIENAIFNFAEATDFTVIGDVNADEIINIQDIVLVVNFILNDLYSDLADLNSDGIIDVLDIVQLVNVILS